MLRIWLMVIAVGGLASDPCVADVLSKIEAGMQAYERGDFSSSVSNWEEAVRAKTDSGKLFYNLGLAYQKTGKASSALAAFLAAEKLIPRNIQVKEGMGAVDTAGTPSGRTASPLVFAWTDFLNKRETVWIVSLTATVAILSLGWGFLLSVAWARNLGFAFLVLVVYAASGLWHKEATPSNWGAIVAAEGTDVFSSADSANQSALFRITDGTPVLVMESPMGDWFKIQLSDGKAGWIKSDFVKFFSVSP
ncbi:MAG: hypothetical protein AB7T49_18805 [Oligoflexales bacterium]